MLMGNIDKKYSKEKEHFLPKHDDTGYEIYFLLLLHPSSNWSIRKSSDLFQFFFCTIFRDIEGGGEDFFQVIPKVNEKSPK